MGLDRESTVSCSGTLPSYNAGGSATLAYDEPRKENTNMKDVIKISVAVDYGNGNVVQHAFNVPVDQTQVAKAVKGAVKKEKQPGKVETEENERKEFLPEFRRFLQTGDISELKAMPDHRTRYKHCVFCQITGVKGRTLYARKPVRVNVEYVGILPPAFFPDDLAEELKVHTDAGDRINVVLLDDGSKPSLIHDIAIVENWAQLGKAFNEMYRQPAAPK